MLVLFSRRLVVSEEAKVEENSECDIDVLTSREDESSDESCSDDYESDSFCGDDLESDGSSGVELDPLRDEEEATTFVMLKMATATKSVFCGIGIRDYLKMQRADPQTGMVPVFLPVLPLEIKSHEGLVHLKKERREYETKPRNRCRVTVEDNHAVVEQIQDSFDADLLDVFHRQEQALPDIKGLFKKDLKMNLAGSDVTARVMDYSKCFKTIVIDNGLMECIRFECGTRSKWFLG
ncbi:hypothetical protein PHMEG_0006835 [Phytophthora megakarya]|uniref:Uncharacterized protein n=1 Tax=Phytophthora megakarya TaxID=4795 RepID=A0A225WMX6_9STRA|nr:hypothetical protein PHMEG_0006835 [Phytophthora megakarya]